MVEGMPQFGIPLPALISTDHQNIKRTYDSCGSWEGVIKCQNKQKNLSRLMCIWKGIGLK